LNGVWYVPKIGTESKFFDWRVVTQHPDPMSLVGTDLVVPDDLLDDAWDGTLEYLEVKWKQHLI